MAKKTKLMSTEAYKESWLRSLVKTVGYRIVIMILDFTVIYFITRRTDIALGFVVVSNIYTTVAYYLYERVWNGISWEKIKIGN